MRHGWVISVVLVALLAGCFTAPAPAEVPQPVRGEPMAGAGYWVFEHAGGPLRFSADEASDLNVYAPDDVRVARLHLGENRSSFTLDDAIPGAWVIQLVHGNPVVTSGDRAVAHFRWLAPQMERHVLIDRPTYAIPYAGLEPFATPLEPLEMSVNLTRTPDLLRLWATGGREALQVEVLGSLGPVLEAVDSATSLDNRLKPVPHTLFPENFRDAHLTVRMEADHLEGAVVLEAWSYSRAEPAWRETTPTGQPAFVYGALGERPTSFDVHPGANEIVLWSDEIAQVVVWDSQGERIAVLTLNGTPQSLAVGGGTHTAHVYFGTVYLGSPRAPADLELHPAVIDDESYTGAFNGSSYSTARYKVDVPGVVYEIVGLSQRSFLPPGIGFCNDGLVRILHDGEFIAAFGDEKMGIAGPLLGNKTVEVTVEGAGTWRCVADGALVRYWVPS